MSNKDLVQEAALKALSRSTKKKPKKKSNNKKAKATASSKADKGPGIDKGPEIDRGPEKKVDKSNRIPEKGSAEAQVHNMAVKNPAPSSSHSPANKQSSNLGFLSLVLLLPLAIVAGLYYYATYMQIKPAQKDGKQVAQTQSAKTNQQAAPASKTHTASQAAKTPAVMPRATTPKMAAVPQKAAPAPVAAPVPPAPQTVPAQHKIHWNYNTTDWAKLDPSFKTCGEGKTQSPINIVTSNTQTGPAFKYNYVASVAKITNNGHSVQADLAKGSQMLVNGKAYDLIQFHFHTPSENQINGRSAPMEAHLVHKNAQGQLAVVAVMIAQGGSNQLLGKMPVPKNNGDGGSEIVVNPTLLLPDNLASLTFSGSLTTPPCTQNVGWIVMKKTLLVSRETLARFKSILGKNNRPIQPANARTVFTSN